MGASCLWLDEYVYFLLSLSLPDFGDSFLFVCAAATSEEFTQETSQETECPVIVYMPEISKTHLGGTMRLGLRPTIFNEGTESWSKIRRLYGGVEVIRERHRHRYEVGPQYIERLEKTGMNFIGRDDKGERMQVLELRGAQSHV